MKSKKHLENDPDQTTKFFGYTKLCKKCNVHVRSTGWEAHLKSKTHLLGEPDKSIKVCKKCNIETTSKS